MQRTDVCNILIKIEKLTEMINILEKKNKSLITIIKSEYLPNILDNNDRLSEFVLFHNNDEAINNMMLKDSFKYILWYWQSYNELLLRGINWY